MSASPRVIQTPVLIVGAGPAGCAASIFLSKAGIRHTVLEKETFPRDKVCGDACSGKTAYVLRSANPAWLHEIFEQSEDYTPSHGILFVAPNGRGLDIPFRPTLRPGEKAPGFTAPRLRFDHFLFQKLDPEAADVQQRAIVQRISRENGGWQVQTKLGSGEEVVFATRLLIGADGDKGVVRKTVIGGNAVEKTYSVGLRAYYTGVQGLHDQNHLELHFLPEVLPGYFWIFPLPNGQTNVGIGMLASHVRRRKINLREVMRAAIEKSPAIRERFRGAQLQGKILGWGLPMCVEQGRISGDGYLLTGDAASLIDPFSGEGIGNALYSGMIAAQAAQKALAVNQTGADFLAENYDRELYRRIGSELRISATLQRLCTYPWLFNFVVNKARKSASLRDTISGMFADLDLRDQLRKPSFYFNILMNR